VIFLAVLHNFGFVIAIGTVQIEQNIYFTEAALPSREPATVQLRNKQRGNLRFT
jgi:hypothetical protein